MTLTVQSQNVSSPHTTPSRDQAALSYIPAETRRPLGEVFYVDFSPLVTNTLDGAIEIDTLVETYEKDPARREAIERARRWVAKEFHSDENNTLKVLRLKKGLSQARLAQIIGTTQAHIARIESGRSDVQVGTLSRLAKALDLDAIRVIKAFLNQETYTSNNG